MPTQYNIRFVAEHPLNMDIAPSGKVVAEAMERLLRDMSLEPVASQTERVDETGVMLDGMIHRVPPVLLLAVAKLFEGELAQKMDPDSDKWDPKFCTGEPWVELVDLAQDIIARRNLPEEVKS